MKIVCFIIIVFSFTFSFASNSDTIKTDDSVKYLTSVENNPKIHEKGNALLDSLYINLEDPSPLSIQIENKNGFWEKYGLTIGTIFMALITFVIGVWNITMANKSLTSQMEINKKNIDSQMKLMNAELTIRKKDKLIDDLIVNFSKYVESLNSISIKLFKVRKKDDSFMKNKIDLDIQKSIINLLISDEEFKSIRDEIISNMDKIDNYFNNLINNTENNFNYSDSNFTDLKTEYNELFKAFLDSFNNILHIR